MNWDGATGTASLGGTRTTGNVTGTPDTAAKRTDVTFTLRPEYHIVIDGTERTFTNANGTKVDPAIYNGSIYLPLRAIGEIMGKSVSWDSATQTVRLDSATSGGDVTDFDTNDPSQSMSTGGVTLEQTKQTALQHVGKTASQVQFVRAQQDWEYGKRSMKSSSSSAAAPAILSTTMRSTWSPARLSATTTMPKITPRLRTRTPTPM